MGRWQLWSEPGFGDSDSGGEEQGWQTHSEMRGSAFVEEQKGTQKMQRRHWRVKSGVELELLVGAGW